MVQCYSKAIPHNSPNSPIFPLPSSISFGDLQIYYHQNFITQIFTNILSYQYFAMYSIKHKYT